MNHFKQHVPGYVHMDSREEFEFGTIDELCSRLKKHRAELRITGRGPFSILMVSENERWWWTLGYVNKHIDLPEWDGMWHTVKDMEGNEFEIRSKDIHWYDGTVGELTDGRRVEFQ